MAASDSKGILLESGTNELEFIEIYIDEGGGYRGYFGVNVVKVIEIKPDLVFTDVVMPKMSGIELVKKIRRDHPKIKVIYISGFFGLRNIKRDLNEDVLKYGYPCLSKPFKISAMLELVDEYINNQIGLHK